MAGHVDPKSDETYRITLTNGGLSYSTITDPDGRWGIVFRYRGTQFEVTIAPLLNRDAETKTMDNLAD